MNGNVPIQTNCLIMKLLTPFMCFNLEFTLLQVTDTSESAIVIIGNSCVEHATQNNALVIHSNAGYKRINIIVLLNYLNQIHTGVM